MREEISCEISVIMCFGEVASSCGIVDVLSVGLLGVCFRPNLIPAARFILPNVGSSGRKAYDSID